MRLLAAACTLALSVALLLARPTSASASNGDVRLPELSDDPVTSNTLVAVYLSVPTGARFALYRIRWEAFQLEGFSLGMAVNTMGLPVMAGYIWLGGIGAKWHFGASRRHEIGFLTYILGVSGYWGPTSHGFRGEGSPDAQAFLPTSVYYRCNLGFVHVEAGLNVPLVFNWFNRVYSYVPPLAFFLGGGF